MENEIELTLDEENVYLPQILQEEKNRQLNEEKRQENDMKLTVAENERKENELKRLSNEEIRIENERQRQEKDEQRDEKITGIEDRLDASDEEIQAMQIDFQNLIKKKTYHFENIEAMKSCLTLIPGDVCQTLGYYSIKDGGNGIYNIRSKTSDDVEDKGSIHFLNNNLVAELITENNTVNVKQFGAKGDGETDDTVAIQNAFAYNKQKTSKILFGIGQYNAKDTIFLYSNTEIDLQNATIYNCSNSVNKAYGGLRFINSLENLQIGYGALKNIIIKNGCFNADFKNIVFATLHCDNLHVQNVHFKNALNDSHIFDMGGCRNVLIENCLVDGFMYSSNSREAFQIDFAGFSNSPYWVDLGYINKENVGYDSLPCKNIIIRNCKFEKGNGTSYPVAIGGHSYYNDYYHENILIENCKFNGFHNYAITLFSMNNITIKNNEFIGYTHSASDKYAILLNPTSEISVDKLFIINNNFKLIDNANSVFVAIFGYNNTKMHKNIIISDNLYNGCYDGINSNSGSDFLQIRYVDNIVISNNIVINPKNIIFSSSNNGRLAFLNNIVKNYRTIYQGDFDKYYARNNSMTDNSGNDIDYSNYEEFIGVRNYILDSKKEITNSNYNIATYTLAEKPIDGQEYTVSLKGKLGEGKTSFYIYNTTSAIELCGLTYDEKRDIYKGTFNWKSKQGSTIVDSTSIKVYVYNSDVTAISSIKWIKLEKGKVLSDWTPAPEDYNK